MKRRGRLLISITRHRLSSPAARWFHVCRCRNQRRISNMSIRIGLAAGIVASFMLPAASNAQVLVQKDVSLRMALTIAEAAIAECGTRTSVAIVDRAGRLRGFLQGDDASPHN